MWYSTWAASPPATTSPHRTIQDPTRFTRCRCGSALRCGLAQLLDDPTVPEEPRGTEPAALVAQAADAVDRVAAAGLLPAGARVAEYGSPHGGSWLGLLADQGLRPVDGTAEADVILDCFGMMHAADQSAALAERTARLAPGGVLLLQYHSLDTIIRQGQWNALRHGHYAYYSTTALSAMLAAVGFSPRAAWRFRSLRRHRTARRHPRRRRRCNRRPCGDRCPDAMVPALLAAEARTGVRDPDVLRGLQRDVQARAAALHDWLAEQRGRGEDRARLRCRLARCRAAPQGRGGRRPAARGGGCLPGQARAAHAGDHDSGDQPGRAHRAAP